MYFDATPTFQRSSAGVRLSGHGPDGPVRKVHRRDAGCSITGPNGPCCSATTSVASLEGIITALTGPVCTMIRVSVSGMITAGSPRSRW